MTTLEHKTVKAMAEALARLVLVIERDENLFNNNIVGVYIAKKALSEYKELIK